MRPPRSAASCLLIGVGALGLACAAPSSDEGSPVPDAGPTPSPPDAGAASAPTREVLLVGNNWDGTVDVLEMCPPFRRLGRVHAAPDHDERLATMPPDRRTAYEINNELAAEGHVQLVDDVAVAPDARTLFVSRPSFGDVAAIDLVTNELLWRVEVSGYRSDHMALTPDGRRLLVSATTANVVDVIDVAGGRIVTSFAAGDFPHENNFSADGTLVYNGSIGRVITPDDPALDATKGRRWLTVADTTTWEVTRVYDFGVGIRPFEVLPDGKLLYAQLSFLHGFVEYDLAEGRILRTVELPITDEARAKAREDYPLDSAHHGLALDRDHARLCVAATVSNYVAVVSRPELTVEAVIPVGAKPYWAVSSTDGRWCFVANSDSDDVSVIDYRAPAEVARVPVGDHPQRMRTATIVNPAPDVPPCGASAAP